MADPTKAASLISDDVHASRSLTYSLENLPATVRDLTSSTRTHTYDRLNKHERDGENDDDHDHDHDEEDELSREMAWQSTSTSATTTKKDSTRRRSSSINDYSIPVSPSTSRQTHHHHHNHQTPKSPPMNPIEADRLRILWWRRAAVNMVFILAWSVRMCVVFETVALTLCYVITLSSAKRYTFSSAISVYNKWMFSADHYNFPYPLFVTSFHMLVQWLLSALTLSMFTNLRSSNRPAPSDYGTKVVPCGVASGLDIGLSNLSLRSITLSFYTMCKSSGLAFVLLFAFLFRLEKPSWRLVGIILIITGGVVLMVSTETQFDLAGMFEVLGASAMGGLRWSLVQILLDKESLGMSNPIATLYWLAPIMGATLAICSMIFDGWLNVFRNEVFFGSLWITMKTFVAMLFPGVLAFAMNITEFGLIQRTSVVTLSVAGIFKEVAVIFLSMFIFHDQLTPINVSGLVVTLFGIALYNYFKYKQFTDDPSSAKSHGGHGGRNRSSISDDHEAGLSRSNEDDRAGGEDMMLLSERERDAARTLGATNASAVYLETLPHEFQASQHTLGSSSSSSPSSSRSSISLPSQKVGQPDSLHLHRAHHGQKPPDSIPDLENKIHQGIEELEKKEKEFEDSLNLTKKNSDEESWDLLIEGGGSGAGK